MGVGFHHAAAGAGQRLKVVGLGRGARGGPGPGSWRLQATGGGARHCAEPAVFYIVKVRCI
jgi:hypothetical protein